MYYFSWLFQIYNLSSSQVGLLQTKNCAKTTDKKKLLSVVTTHVTFPLLKGFSSYVFTVKAKTLQASLPLVLYSWYCVGVCLYVHTRHQINVTVLLNPLALTRMCLRRNRVSHVCNPRIERTYAYVRTNSYSSRYSQLLLIILSKWDDD